MVICGTRVGACACGEAADVVCDVLGGEVRAGSIVKSDHEEIGDVRSGDHLGELAFRPRMSAVREGVQLGACWRQGGQCLILINEKLTEKEVRRQLTAATLTNPLRSLSCSQRAAQSPVLAETTTIVHSREV